MRKLILAIFTLGVAGLLVMIATPSMAVHKNFNNQLYCGGCHTMHNSQGGVTLEGNAANGGSIVLLRGDVALRKDVHNLCLQCHGSNGSQATGVWDGHTAPKVYIDGAEGDGNGFSLLDTNPANDDFINIGAGGDFSAAMEGDSSGWAVRTTALPTFGTVEGTTPIGRGHSLGLATATPPGNADGDVTDFTCTSCHDPHGAYNVPTTEANRFRNLKRIPRDSGSTNVLLNANIRSYVGYGGCDADANWTNGSGSGATFIWPVYTTGADWSTDTSDCYTAGGRVNSYGVSTGNATDGIANWCATCHDDWHEDLASGGNDQGLDWQRHPVDNLLNDGTTTSGGNVTIVDTTNYNVARDAGRGLPIATTDSSPVFYLQDATTDKVFCLSCHFAHGGPYYDNLRWDYLETVQVADPRQTANTISSVVGCQLCHNR